jgi:hypothetical protein
MPSPDPNSSKDSKRKSSEPSSRRAERVGKADSFPEAVAKMKELQKDHHESSTVVIYSRRAVGNHYWRQDPDGKGDALGRAPKDSQLMGYVLLRVPRDLVSSNALADGDSEDLKKAIRSALDGGGEGPSSDVGPR